MDVFLYTVIFLIFLLLTYQILYRYPIITWLIFLIAPFALIPLARTQHNEYFVWIKVFSVAIGIYWLQTLRYTRLGQKNWALWVAWVMVAINISEAVAQSLLHPGMVNFINSLTGLFLIITLPRPGQIHIDTTSPYRSLIWDTPMIWVIGYVIWNWVFIYTLWPALCVRHLAVLGAPFLIALYDNRLFEQARPLTLGPYMLLDFAFVWLLKPMDVTGVYYYPLAMGLALLGCVIMLVHVMREYALFKAYKA